jgi:3-oxoacyl-[acyl-carrier protein] reductase
MTQPFDLNLSGRTALVCGASAGIGAAAAQTLAQMGASVIALARSDEKLRAVIERLPVHKKAKHRFIACDLNDHLKLKSLIEAEVSASEGAIEILINNSAGPKGGPITEAAGDEFARAFHQHVLTSQLLVQIVLPGMKTRGYGRIVNVISTSVRMPIPGLGVSNVVRGATASWAKTLALEVAPWGITVNSVLPGYTKTERLSSLVKAAADRLKKSEKEIEDEWKAATPVKRFGEPQELAAAIGFLTSPAAGFITGVALPVDGGRIGAI